MLETLAAQPAVAPPVSAQKVELKLAVEPTAAMANQIATQPSQVVDVSASDSPEPFPTQYAVDHSKAATVAEQLHAFAGPTLKPAPSSMQQVDIQSPANQPAQPSLQPGASVADAPAQPTPQAGMQAGANRMKWSEGVASTHVTNSATGEAVKSANPAVARAEQLNAAVRIENALAIETGVPTSVPSISGAATRGQILNRDFALTPAWIADAAPEADQQITTQLTRGLSAMMNQRGGVMNMRLSPPELGELRVQMTLAKGVVSAEFQATTATAHAMLERSIWTLRAALESQGFTVDRLTVHGLSHAVGQSSLREDSSGQGSSSHSSQSDRGSHDAAGGESRGRNEQAHTGAERRFEQADFARFVDDLNGEGDLEDAVATGTRN